MEQIVETWLINNRISLYLLESIDEAWLHDVAASKGRSVGDQFGHIHNVRLMWIKEAEPDLINGLIKIESGTATKEGLFNSLEASGKAIGQLLEIGLKLDRIKGFKPHPTAYLGYLISHESHHRGQIILSIKQSGHCIDKKNLYGIWEWGSRYKEIIID